MQDFFSFSYRFHQDFPQEQSLSNVFWNFACKGNKISCYSKNLNKQGLRVSRQTSPVKINAQRKREMKETNISSLSNLNH